jgi:2-amino-4-hydroxy-6-hydroxymethyldihydropteridine diphosphokinase
MPVIANVPAATGRGDWSHPSGQQQVPASIEKPWVSGFVPILPALTSDQTGSPMIPRLVARIQRTTPETRWPAPHQMWPSGWKWPEYRLEVDDMNWAVGEIASALRSMRCPLSPVTEDGNWWVD